MKKAIYMKTNYNSEKQNFGIEEERTNGSSPSFSLWGPRGKIYFDEKKQLEELKVLIEEYLND